MFISCQLYTHVTNQQVKNAGLSTGHKCKLEYISPYYDGKKTTFSP